MMSWVFSSLTRRIQKIALLVGVAGFAISFIGAYFQGQEFFLSYLFAYLFWIGISLGGMVIVMIHHLTGGAWGVLICRPLEAAARALPLMTVLFVPLIFGLSDLYAWARPEMIADEPLLGEKSSYLNISSFLIRAAGYFVVWIGIAYWLHKWSIEQERNPQPKVAIRLYRLSIGGIILYSLSITFAATDWIMSLVPQWHSTVFGLLWGVGQMLSALAFAILMAAAFYRPCSLSKEIVFNRFHDLGNLLLMLVMLWAYLAFMQYLIIWSGNLPHEISWYLPRVQGSWQELTVMLIAFHFLVPLIVLLFRYAKRTISILGTIAMIVLLAHLIDSFWLVVPSLRTQELQLYWTDFMAPLGIGGVWLAAVLWQFQKRPFILVRDANIKETWRHGK
ncbi:conserved hypothetical protein [Nitrosococcus halophilus Nc 4]|uniref:Quinol:cytochrome c oxidoreductase quinone-binding subunit 2 n=1 Tax=Nitrosococcus halophilus (strain Nc4) TaxID=472759 RepID=D5BWM7_NITHN|nr:hypothetical protein [Nitrosococcus halophilus]ADE15684.1 conserved hypothetical protein [Nitrosococcus halophilus Nc 4]